MTTITFDTLKFVQTLEKAGVPHSQAEAFAEAFRQAQSEGELANLTDMYSCDGVKSACPARRGAMRDAGPSGERRNDVGRPI